MTPREEKDHAAKRALSQTGPAHIIVSICNMAAASPIGAPVGKAGSTGSPVVNVMRIAVLAILAGGSIYLALAHREWFADPRMVKTQVLSYGGWGPAVYILLYAVGPSFLVPGAVMTLAGGLAFGAFWGAIWSLIGANLGALIAFAAGRFCLSMVSSRQSSSYFRVLSKNSVPWPLLISEALTVSGCSLTNFISNIVLPQEFDI
jgi:uncharacterized membrane protein YdjX (TVP38/TMEM64 family)